MKSVKGFILSSSSADNSGRAEVCYYGKGEDGPFKIVITNPKPLFFVEQDARIPDLPGMFVRELDLKSFNREPVKGLYFDSFDRYYNARRELHAQGITTFESDVWPADRYLMERFIHTGVEITGEPEPDPAGQGNV